MLNSRFMNEVYCCIQIVLIALCLVVLAGCNGEGSSRNANIDTVEQKPREEYNNASVSFFGETMAIGDSTHIMEQIKNIAEKDTMLSVKGNVLVVGSMEFGINIKDGDITLISSTQVDDPKVNEVVKYMNSIYGEGYEDDPDNYWWNSTGSNGKTIRMRPLHSDEGGTIIMFY